MFLHDYLLACEISTVRTQTLRSKIRIRLDTAVEYSIFQRLCKLKSCNIIDLCCCNKERNFPSK